MLTNQPKPVRRAAPGLVLALFRDRVSVRYAVLDLYQAGFGAGQIRIAVSSEGKQAREPLYRASRLKPILSGMPKHGFELGPYGRVPHLEAGDDGSASSESKRLYSEVDLEEMLQKLGVAGLGVADEGILFPDRETGRHGTLVLVDAGGRSREVHSILEWNRGWVRTDMAAEQIPPAA